MQKRFSQKGETKQASTEQSQGRPKGRPHLLYFPMLTAHLGFNSERSDLRFEGCAPVFVRRDMGVHMIDLQKETSKPVLKLDFTAHGIMESLSEFGPCGSKCVDAKACYPGVLFLAPICPAHLANTAAPNCFLLVTPRKYLAEYAYLRRTNMEAM
jgi:hypothetical protein